MADAYRGLTIEIDGNTTKLSAALRSVNSEIKSTSYALKDCEKALKLDPGNTELVAQKQQLLGKQVQETTTKLKELKAAKQEYESKGSMSDEDVAGYQKVQREIAKTESSLKGYQSSLQAATRDVAAQDTALGQLGTKMQEVSGKASTAGKTLDTGGKALGTAAVAAGTAAVKAFSDVEDGENDAIKTTGAVGDAADALRESVDNVAQAAPGDFEAVGDAVGGVSQRFGLTGDSLDTLSEQFLSFAKVTGEDVSTSIDEVGRSMDAFGVPADQASNVLDMISSTSQQTGIDISTLTGDLDTNGATFREMGLSIQDSAALLGNFEQAGIPADTMLTGLKKAATNCAASGKDMGTELQTLSKQLQDPATEAQATTEALDLFGKKSGLAFVDAAKSGRINLADLGSSLDSYSGSVTSTKDETTSAMDKIKGAWKSIEVALKPIGETIANVVVKVADNVKQMSQSFQQLPNSTKETIAKIIMVTAALAPLLVAVGKVMQSFDSMGKVLVKVAGFFATSGAGATGFGAKLAALCSGPVALVVLAIAGVVLALTKLWNTNESFRNAVTSAMSQITNAIKPCQEAFGRIAKAVEPLGGPTMTILNGLCNIIGGVFVAAFTTAASVIGGAMQVISGVIETVVGVIEGIVGVFVGIFTGDWSMAGNGATLAMQGMGDAVSGILSALSGTIDGILNGIVGIFTGNFNGIKNAASDAVGAVVGCFANMHFPDIHVPTFHVSGGFNLDPANFQVPNISFYGNGGYVSTPTAGVFGERTPEYLVPQDTSYLGRLAGDIVDAMSTMRQASSTLTVYISGEVNSRDDVNRYTYDYLKYLNRIGVM